LKDVPVKRVMKMNAKEWPYITLGCIMALLRGSVHPFFALIFGSMLGVSFHLELLPFVIRWLVYKHIIFCCFQFHNTWCLVQWQCSGVLWHYNYWL